MFCSWRGRESGTSEIFLVLFLVIVVLLLLFWFCYCFFFVLLLLMLFCYCYCFCFCWRGREPGTSEIDSCCLDNCSCYLSPKITFSALAPFSSTAGNLLYVIEHFLKGQKSKLFTRIRMIASYFLSLQAGKCYNELECIGRGGAIKGYCSPRALGVRRRRIWCQLISQLITLRPAVCSLPVGVTGKLLR